MGALSFGVIVECSTFTWSPLWERIGADLLPARWQVLPARWQVISADRGGRHHPYYRLTARERLAGANRGFTGSRVRVKPENVSYGR